MQRPYQGGTYLLPGVACLLGAVAAVEQLWVPLAVLEARRKQKEEVHCGQRRLLQGRLHLRS